MNFDEWKGRVKVLNQSVKILNPDLDAISLYSWRDSKISNVCLLSRLNVKTVMAVADIPTYKPPVYAFSYKGLDPEMIEKTRLAGGMLRVGPDGDVHVFYMDKYALQSLASRAGVTNIDGTGRNYLLYCDIFSRLLRQNLAVRPVVRYFKKAKKSTPVHDAGTIVFNGKALCFVSGKYQQHDTDLFVASAEAVLSRNGSKFLSGIVRDDIISCHIFLTEQAGIQYGVEFKTSLSAKSSTSVLRTYGIAGYNSYLTGGGIVQSHRLPLETTFPMHVEKIAEGIEGTKSLDENCLSWEKLNSSPDIKLRRVIGYERGKNWQEAFVQSGPGLSTVLELMDDKELPESTREKLSERIGMFLESGQDRGGTA